MKFSSILASTALTAGALVSAKLDPIVTKGSKFFYKNGTEFFMRGIAYQQEWGSGGDGSTNGVKYTDPLADPKSCKRDIPLLQELRTNTIRVYAIHPEADHDECMEMLDDAGIYVVADLSEPATSIVRSDPKWDLNLYERYTDVIDSLAGYSNVLGFFAGNEVTNNVTNTDASAFVKAAVRDMKKYIKDKDYRPMGVGYATNDDAEIRDDLVDYFYCGSKEEIVDFWGYNIYSWCGKSSFKESGFDKVVKDFTGFSVPVFFAEYGCNEVKTRPFTEVEAIYGPKMTPVLSGGIVYMYFQEENDYGLVEIEDGSSKPTKLKDFENLKEQMAEVDPEGTTFDEFKPKDLELHDCPAISKKWESHENLPFTPNKELCDCMVESLTCVPNDNIKPKELGKLFGSVCGMDPEACIGISSNATTGEYGAYSMCKPSQQLAFAFDRYYHLNGENDNSCDFDGNAHTQTASGPEGNCADLLDEAGEEGTGTTGGSGGSGTDDDDDEPSSAASPLSIPGFNFGALNLGSFVFCAMIAGAGMIFV